MPQYLKVYHLSPHANIQRFTGSYSPKIGARGLFVSESWISVLKDWVETLLSKRFGRRKPSTLKKRRRRLQRRQDILEDANYSKDSEEYQYLDKKISSYWKGDDLGSYKSITIYQLLIPRRIFEACEQQMEELTAQAFSRQGMAAFGGWAWGIETFIFEEFLDSIQIAGRKTYSADQALALGEQNRLIRDVQRNNIYQKMKDYQKKIEKLIERFGKAPLLDRALRYAKNIDNVNIDIKNVSRHYKVIEDLIAPYLLQED